MDLSHLNEKYRDLALLPNDARIRAIKDFRWIGYTVAANLINELEYLLDYPKQTRMPSLLIVGKPNNGKSSILERFYALQLEKAEEESEIDGQPNFPIVKVQASKSDTKQLYIEILEQFWTPYRASQTSVVLRQQAVKVMRECNVKMLVIDEFHSLLTGSNTQQREMMNEIKYLTNILKIPVVGAGTQEAIRVLHTDPQHASRFDLAQLPTWEFNKAYLQLLLSFEVGLPLRKRSNLIEPEKAKLILSISQGIIGNIHALLKKCAITAITDGRECIDLNLVREHKWYTPTKGQREVRL